MGNYDPFKFLRFQKKERYARAHLIVKKLLRILVDKYQVKKVVLIGSCLEDDRFHSHSDIDLCTEGLSGTQYFQAVGELLIESEEFDVDLIPIEDSNERMKEYIKKGKVLYERRQGVNREDCV
ncbi:MAG: nucleotidyltransferase domain-containing protein [bacterium]|nr:nucleotidyltransferase domain-containing protein [bacterium]